MEIPEHHKAIIEERLKTLEKDKKEVLITGSREYSPKLNRRFYQEVLWKNGFYRSKLVIKNLESFGSLAERKATLL